MQQASKTNGNEDSGGAVTRSIHSSTAPGSVNASTTHQGAHSDVRFTSAPTLHPRTGYLHSCLHRDEEAAFPSEALDWSDGVCAHACVCGGMPLGSRRKTTHYYPALLNLSCIAESQDSTTQPQTVLR